MTESDKDARKWWGEYTIPPGMAGQWLIGPARIVAEHHDKEWILVTDDASDNRETDCSIEIPLSLPGEYPPHATLNRFGMNNTDSPLSLMPSLADRPVVIHPEYPFTILPDQSVPFYVTTPVWAEIGLVRPTVTLMDFPLLRPSDTWFGETTMEGVLCYASMTSGRLKFEEIQFRPHRALTVVVLTNNSQIPILLSKLNLPVNHLSIYESEDGYLWTQPVTLDIRKDGEQSDLKIKQRAPKDAKNPSLIRKPRIAVKENVISKTLQNLIK